MIAKSYIKLYEKKCEAHLYPIIVLLVLLSWGIPCIFSKSSVLINKVVS